MCLLLQEFAIVMPGTRVIRQQWKMPKKMEVGAEDEVEMMKTMMKKMM